MARRKTSAVVFILLLFALERELVLANLQYALMILFGKQSNNYGTCSHVQMIRACKMNFFVNFHHVYRVTFHFLTNTQAKKMANNTVCLFLLVLISVLCAQEYPLTMATMVFNHYAFPVRCCNFHNNKFNRMFTKTLVTEELFEQIQLFKIQEACIMMNQHTCCIFARNTVFVLLI